MMLSRVQRGAINNPLGAVHQHSRRRPCFVGLGAAA